MTLIVLLCVIYLSVVLAGARAIDRRTGGDTPESVEWFTRRSLAGGCDGVVCAVPDIPLVRQIIATSSERIIVPGIRLAGGDVHDQVRVGTPRDAIEKGATDLVGGRAITAPPPGTSSLQALEAFAEEMMLSVAL